MQLLTMICILIACQAFAQTVMPVEYKNVLKSRVSQIQSDINQFRTLELRTLLCHHSPVLTGNSTKIVMFVWASERETNAMRNCLYKYMKAIAKAVARKPESCNIITAILCNRSANIYTTTEWPGNKKVILLSLYFKDIVTDKLTVNDTRAWYFWYSRYIPTVTSAIDVRPIKNIDSHVQTLICNSVQLTLNKTGKLRQRFFSLTGNSTETIIKSTHNRSATVPLYFDVLALNASRPGLLNSSNIELLSLSRLQVSCAKYDQYALNNETNEIVRVNVTEELVLATKAIIIDEKLRLYVNVSIPFVSDHTFGTYVCWTGCELRTRKDNLTKRGCDQLQYFSIVSDYWRDENLLCRQANINLEEQNKYLYYCLIVPIVIIIAIIAYREIKTFFNLKVLRSVTSVLESMKTCNDRIIKYDVFLSYSSKDRPWVQSKLLKFIESKGFKVCFDERDFLLGCNLVQTIATAVYESRKVIAVVSPNYLESGWWQFEFVLTYTKILNKEAPYNSLLLIKYKNCHMPEHMRCLKYLDYTKVTTVDPSDDNRSVIMKAWSCVIKLFRRVEVRNAISENQFFDHLLSWLRS